MENPLLLIVQFSHSVVSNCLWPHGLQHARIPHPSVTPRACSNSCLSSQWWHTPISSSVIHFSSCLKSFPASGGQIIGASASVLPMNIPWLFSFRIDWFDLRAVQGTLKNLPQHHSSILQCSAFLIVQLSHPYITTGKKELWLNGPLSAK